MADREGARGGSSLHRDARTDAARVTIEAAVCDTRARAHTTIEEEDTDA
jgi:hypothetical protein